MHGAVVLANSLYIRLLLRTDLLYWDDLGQMHLTGSASEMLLHVVEERSNSEMPILATTQYSGEGIDAQFERKEIGESHQAPAERVLPGRCGALGRRSDGT